MAHAVFFATFRDVLANSRQELRYYEAASVKLPSICSCDPCPGSPRVGERLRIAGPDGHSTGSLSGFPYNLALVFAGLGKTETALQWLERAFADRDVHMPFLLDHKWDRIKRTPQFQDLLSRVGFLSVYRTA